MVTSWFQRTFQALSHGHYRILWIGTTLSFLAFSMQNVAQGVVAFNITGKNGDVGAVSLGMGLATIATAPFGGVIADRVSRRKLLLIGQTTIGFTFFLIGLLIVVDRINIPWLIASTFVMGMVFSFIAPARQAWVGEFLKGPALTNGIALQQIAMTGTRIVGPWMAVALIAAPAIGSGGAYLFMGGLFVLVVATLARLPTSVPSSVGRGSPMADLKLGFEHVRSRPRLAILSISFIGVVITGFSYQVLLPGYVHNELGRSTKDIGFMFGIAGAAGLVGTIAVTNMASSRHAFAVLLGSGAILGVSLVLLSGAQSFGQVLLVMCLAGAGQSMFQMLNNSLVMQESDPAYYGRVMSLTMLAWGFNSLAGYPLGELADGIGERPTLAIMGAGVFMVLAATALARRLSSPPAARLSAIPAADAVGSQGGQ